MPPGAPDFSLVLGAPDRVGGLGFLANRAYAYTALAVAHGALLAGPVANRIFFVGAKRVDFKMEAAAIVCLLLAIPLGPLLAFTGQLAQAKRTGLRE